MKLIFSLLLCLTVSVSLFAQTADTSAVKVTGEVLHPLTLKASDLMAMPRTTVSARDKQGVPHEYTGVALSEIFSQAGVTTGPQLRGKNLAKYLLVTCADGYQVVFSLAELDSAFTDRVVILADHTEGKPLPAGMGPFRVIVPGEKKPARSAFQVVALEVRFAK